MILLTIVILIILTVAYLQINHNNSYAPNKIRTLIKKYIDIKHNNNVYFFLSPMKIAFSRKNAKTFIILIFTTLFFAFIFYNYIFFTVPISNSMSPTFVKGDLVLMQKFDVIPHEGDIIMFGVAVIGKDQIITHRVYSITPEGIQTKGDATAVDYWKIPPEDIYAKAITVGNKPIVIKSIGHYFLDTQFSSTYAREFGFMQAIVQGGKKLGLLIFVICLVAYTWLSVNDMKKQRKIRRRN